MKTLSDTQAFLKRINPDVDLINKLMQEKKTAINITVTAVIFLGISIIIIGYQYQLGVKNREKSPLPSTDLPTQADKNSQS